MKEEGERCPLDPVAATGSTDLTDQLWKFRIQYREGRDPEKILRAALKLGIDLFGGKEGCIATIHPGAVEARLIQKTTESGWWDRALLAGFLRGEKVNVPHEMMLARIRRHGRMWGVLALRAPGASFHWDARQGFSTIGGLANELIDQSDLQRIREVRARVDRKVMEQSHPKHLSYELLHGIRSLTAYDHSAALLIHDADLGVLEVVAEQIAWRKAKGENVGRKFPLKKTLHEVLAQPVVRGFDRHGDEWKNWTGGDPTDLADLLDYDPAPKVGDPAPPEGAILCASLITRSGLLGVLKVASMHAGSFCQYEVDLISQFLPQAAVALQNARRAETLERRMIDAERKHAMADLARGVSHDVNNALGAVLPLVQQLLDDVEHGAFDPEEAAGDLRQVERSIRVCRRIFGGMLNFARGSARNPSDVSLAQAVDAALLLFREGLERRGVALVVNVAADLPSLFAVQADFEQLLLNLISNARDATGPGDRLTIKAGAEGDWLELVVEDTGCGISADDLAKLQEPFFTTKPNGHGLGLAICRSITAQLRGQFDIRSEPGAGTRVRMRFPTDIGKDG
ncbi:sensor histidine kinase [Paludisphaera borealis]|uniref:histidine kinase n=1 Tax=Paludisphaera borealis TaxID=1387353 RepID=A0A1U7CM11_9BACT|nr:HAMP domain-containing sensor histidine kinase [Paludisphaera borealis]APW59972.1 Sensor protein ZraS [Paludisphaera borealis]